MRSKIVWSLAAVFLCLTVWAQDDAKDLPDGPGKDITAKACIDCHGAANFRKLRLTEDEWWDKVGDMVTRGAKASDKEQADVVAYLVRFFGKDSKVLMNTAPQSELIVVLHFTPAESQALASYRADYGPFKEWRDLQKVPGLDPKKLEAQKDKMAF